MQKSVSCDSFLKVTPKADKYGSALLNAMVEQQLPTARLILSTNRERVFKPKVDFFIGSCSDEDSSTFYVQHPGYTDYSKWTKRGKRFEERRAELKSRHSVVIRLAEYIRDKTLRHFFGVSKINTDFLSKHVALSRSSAAH